MSKKPSFFRKIIIVLLSLFLLIIGAAIAIPILYEEEIEALIQNEANKQLNAELSFADLDLSLFRSFPRLSVGLEDLKLTGKGSFEGLNLAQVGQFEAEVDLFTMLGDGSLSIKGIHIDGAQIYVKVLEDGAANYDITLPGEELEEVENETSSEEPFIIQLESYSIKNSSIVYDDASLAFLLSLKGLNHSGSGDFTSSIFDLNTQSEIQELSLSYEGVPYLYKSHLDLKAGIHIDMDAMAFTFNDNKALLNALPLHFEGSIEMPSDPILFDLSFEAPQAGFKEALSLVPAIYASDMSGLSAAGNFNLKGKVKGAYTEESMPGMEMALWVKDGSFGYQGLPERMEKVNIDFALQMPEGNNLDLMQVHLKTFAMEFGGQSLRATALLNQLENNPHFDISAHGGLNFGALQQLIPLEEGMQLAGEMTLDMDLKGNQKAIESNQFSSVQAEGKLLVKSLEYMDQSLSAPISIPEAELTANTQKMELKNLKIKSGQSDIEMQGKLSNALAYLFTEEGVLTGNLRVNSKKLIASDFMPTSETPETKEEIEEEPLAIIPIPKNIQFDVEGAVNELDYDGMNLKNVQAKLKVADQKAAIENLSMNGLGGEIALKGSYATPTDKKALIDLGLDFKSIQWIQAIETISTIEQLAPIAKFGQGIVDLNLNFSGALDSALSPILSSLNGAGLFASKAFGIKGVPATEKLATALNKNDLKSMTLNDLSLPFAFENGQIEVKPFAVNLAGQQAKVSGRTALDGGIDFTIKTKAETAGLKNLPALSNWPAAIPFPESLPLNIGIGGTFLKPTVDLNLKSAVSTYLAGQKDAFKNQAKETIENKVEETKEELNNAIEEKRKAILEAAQKQADALKAKAKEAGARLISEANKKGQKLIAEAGNNPLKKKAAELAAAKLEKEAREKANQLNKEAEEQAKKIMNEARERAAKIQV